jgi:trimethylamine---corrinoid protein Co-methyltransferase
MGFEARSIAIMSYFAYWTETEVEQIHEATLRLLDTVGIRLTHTRALEMLQDHGGKQRNSRITIPPDLVMHCLSLCPSEITQAGRDPKRSVILGRGGFKVHNAGGIPTVFEPVELVRRPATREDNVRGTRLLDALPNVDTITPVFTPQDVPPEVMQLWMYFDTVANTTKPPRAPGAHTAADVRALTELTRIAFPGDDLCHHGMALSPISPLYFPDDLVDAMLLAAELGWAFGPLPCPVAGQTAPMSMAGAVMQQNAELLASIVLAQLTRPGLPVSYHGRLSPMDPRTAFSIWGAPEVGIMSAGTVQLGRFYHLPTNVYGICSSAQSLDLQDGYERAINALVPVMAGADEISGPGDMAEGLMGSLAQMVIDNEILNSVRRVARGMTVDEDSLALELIGQVAESGSGNYLAESHTVRYLRRGEMIKSGLARRENWEQWDRAGRPTMAREAVARAEELVAKNEVLPLSPEQEAEMLAVIEAVRTQRLQ